MKRATRRTRAASHERIVEAGARAIRRQGYNALSIASVMKEVDLTHGGFYAHFASREAMLVELSDRAGAQAVATFSRIAAAAPAESALQALLRTDLSEMHVKQPEIGCPIAALGTEMPRQAPPVRHAVTRHIKEMIDLISRHAADWGQTGAHERALVTTATLVGTVVLARAVDEAALSESVLRATRAHLGAAHDPIPDALKNLTPTETQA
jgi:TetR/AcrR family transcriptional regulator, transcriptional repressor for nem operon